MTDDTTNFLEYFHSRHNQKHIVFLKTITANISSLMIPKIKPHNGFTENKFILHKAKQYRKHNI